MPSLVIGIGTNSIRFAVSKFNRPANVGDSTATFCPKFDGSACGAGLVPANAGETEPQLSLYFRQVNIEF